MTKMLPCCSKYVTQERNTRAEIARLSRLAVRAQDKGRLDRVASYQARIEAEKQNLAELKSIAIDHEAEHAEREAALTELAPADGYVASDF